MTYTASRDDMLAELSKEIITCKRCPLHLTRNKPLVGEGTTNVNIMMIGEAPGYNEDLQGKAFIGKAGAILDKLLSHINLSREDIYITNILKCHPPQNHNPTTEEINGCVEYLYSQIKIICPKIIVTLGKFASQAIFSKVFLPFSKISEMHGEIFEITASYGQVKILPHYHPSAACYNISMFDTLKYDFEITIGKLINQGK